MLDHLRRLGLAAATAALCVLVTLGPGLHAQSQAGDDVEAEAAADDPWGFEDVEEVEPSL